MTSTTVPGLPAGHYRFRNVAAMEWRKLRSLPATRWTLLATVIGSVGLGAAVLGSYSPGHFTRMTAEQRAAFDPTNMGFAGTAIAMLALPILGVLAMTGEYSSGMIRATLAAVPNRRLVLAAKAAVFGAAGLAVGELVVFANFLAGEAVLTGTAPHASLSQPAVLRAVLLTGVYLGVLGLVGLGFGAIIRHTAGAITAVVGGLFVLPMIILIAGGESALDSVGKYAPMFINENSVGAVKPVAHALSAWAGLGMIFLYAAVACGLGGWLLHRRDA
jgi:ABC-2 type transport system permease protein